MNTCYDSTMSESDKLINFIATTVEGLRQRIDSISEQMATKVDLANLRDEMAAMKDQMVTKDELAAVKAQMATKDELKEGLAALRIEMARKSDLGRLETTMRGEFEQVHLRLDSIDRRVDTRIGQVETDVSRLRSVVYLLVNDKPDMLRLLGRPDAAANRLQN